MNEPTQTSQLPSRINDPVMLPTEFTAFGSIAHFADAQRMAKALYTSSIVPDGYRGEQHMGDCVIALEIANRIGANVLAVMQNLYIVHGRPAWSSQFLIACVNASRRFSPLRYVMTEKGEPKQVEYTYTTYVQGNKVRNQGKETVVPQGCYAWALDKSGERLESPMVTIDMAVKEGWYTKDGSKWRTMPELMLRYRAATLFARLYAPELTMGIQSADEIEDVIDISPVVTEPSPPKELTQGEAPKKTRFVKTPAPPVEVSPEPEPPTATTAAAVPAQPPPSTSATTAAPPTDNPELAAVLTLLSQHNITPAGLLAFCHREKLKIADTLEATERRNLGNLARALGADKSPMLAKLKEFCKPATA